LSLKVITEDVYKLLQSQDVGLKTLQIPIDKESGILSFKKPDKV
jgi:hypothetical protein